MYIKSFALVAALFGSAIAAPAAHVLHEKREVESTTFVKRSAVPVGRALPVRIGLQQSNLDIAHDLLMEISSHDSPRFGQHLSAEEVIELFAPKQSSVDIVRAWLESNGIENVSQSVNKQWMQADIAVEKLEDLLKTKYYEHVHVESGDVHVACDEYHVPAHVQEHIDYITPGTQLSKIAKHKRKVDVEATKQKRSDFSLPPIIDQDATADANTTSFLHITTCGCVKLLYNITVGNTSVPGNELGIFEDLNDILDQKDLNQFFSETYPTIPKGTTPILKPVDGAPGLTSQANGGGESTLDFELAYPIVYPQSIVLFQTDDKPTEADYEYEGFLNNFFDAIDGSYCSYTAYNITGNSPIDPPYPDPKAGGYKGQLQCGVYKPTNVISISYGGGEDFNINYQRRQCDEIMKLGLQGVSVVVSSGDDGVSTQGYCLGPKNKIFAPGFPTTCPYITSIGSTFLPYPRNAAIDNERATNRFSSGGGFSNIYPQPSYQQAVVQSYLTNYPPGYKSYQTLYNQSVYGNSGFGANGGIYNSIGRGYPDFAAVGDGILSITNGRIIIEGGTSASAPIFASILTRINEHRLMAGKSTVGFVNPTLYANPSVLHDITEGNNKACGTNGFKAAPGWDPVTGMGTPNYAAMLKLYMSLP